MANINGWDFAGASNAVDIFTRGNELVVVHENQIIAKVNCIGSSSTVDVPGCRITVNAEEKTFTFLPLDN